MDQVFTVEDENKRLVNKRLPPDTLLTEYWTPPEKPTTPEQAERKTDRSFGLDVSGIHRSADENVYNKMSGNCMYDPDYAPLLVYHMGKGFTFRSFASVIGVNTDTLYNWLKTFKDFKFCREVAEMRMQLKWEKIILDAAQGRVKGNAAAIIFAIKNYFPDTYKDKREIEHTASVMLVDTGIKRVDGNIIEGEFKQLDRRRRPVIQDKPSVIDIVEDLEEQL